MELQGICQKMHADLTNQHVTEHNIEQANVEYTFILDKSKVELPFELGETIQIEWTGRVQCISCGATTPKSYAQGHCFKCFKTKADCDLCIMKPETCHHHLGTCRDESFAQRVCFQPHIIYLANSSALKVGITRISQIPTRWLDQGAIQALPIMTVGSRRLSGKLEVMFGEQVADKTNWRALLKGESELIDLISIRDQLLNTFSDKIQIIRDEFSQNLDLNESIRILENERAKRFIYPVNEYPIKIKSHNLDKTPLVQGVLMGIKGQYLLLDTGVINMRKYTGYEIILRA